jgi:hypothetical protein
VFSVPVPVTWEYAMDAQNKRDSAKQAFFSFISDLLDFSVSVSSEDFPGV